MQCTRYLEGCVNVQLVSFHFMLSMSANRLCACLCESTCMFVLCERACVCVCVCDLSDKLSLGYSKATSRKVSVWLGRATASYLWQLFFIYKFHLCSLTTKRTSGMNRNDVCDSISPPSRQCLPSFHRMWNNSAVDLPLRRHHWTVLVLPKSTRVWKQHIERIAPPNRFTYCSFCFGPTPPACIQYVAARLRDLSTTCTSCLLEPRILKISVAYLVVHLIQNTLNDTTETVSEVLCYLSVGYDLVALTPRKIM